VREAAATELYNDPVPVPALFEKCHATALP
jgi:hypothetical protein